MKNFGRIAASAALVVLSTYQFGIIGMAVAALILGVLAQLQKNSRGMIIMYGAGLAGAALTPSILTALLGFGSIVITIPLFTILFVIGHLLCDIL